MKSVCSAYQATYQQATPRWSACLVTDRLFEILNITIKKAQELTRVIIQGRMCQRVALMDNVLIMQRIFSNILKNGIYTSSISTNDWLVLAVVKLAAKVIVNTFALRL